ncbi:MAG: hypothetical protein WA210_16130 [Burkholderiaceae bacterium]
MIDLRDAGAARLRIDEDERAAAPLLMKPSSPAGCTSVAGIAELGRRAAVLELSNTTR